MSGPEHYAEAERCLTVAESTHWQGPTADVEFAQTAIAAAQVHATLALVAATVDASPAGRDVWVEATR